MKYNSTCGSEKGVSFETALLSGGYTTAGGVFIPDHIPLNALSAEQLSLLKDVTFPDISKYVASKFISPSEIPPDDLDVLISRGLSRSKFTHPDFIPIVDLPSESAADGEDFLLMAEAFHSPSLVFKDYSMQIVGQYINYFSGRTLKRGVSGGDKKNNVLICTTGDTGSSAIEALRGLDKVNVIVGFPDGGQITDFQRKQMTTVRDANIHCFQAEGTCDDIDMVYVDLFSDPNLVEEFKLTSANSTNWARIMGQIAIYVCIYLQCIATLKGKKLGDALKIVVPTGACGNLCSALFAKQMGLPIKIVVANNSNAFFYRLFSTGEIVVDSANQRRTLSNAMDSQWSPSLTRILWLLAPEDTENFGQSAIRKIKKGEKLFVSEKAMSRLRELVVGCEVASDEETTDMMIHVHSRLSRQLPQQQAVICPHTAVGFVALLKHNMKKSKKFGSADGLRDVDDSLLSGAVVMATAHPDKFSSVITNNAHIPYRCSRSFDGCEERFEVVKKSDNWRERVLNMLFKANGQ